MIKKIVNFGTLPPGCAFKILGDPRIWHLGQDRRQVYTLKDDGRTREYKAAPPFNESCLVDARR